MERTSPILDTSTAVIKEQNIHENQITGYTLSGSFWMSGSHEHEDIARAEIPTPNTSAELQITRPSKDDVALTKEETVSATKATAESTEGSNFCTICSKFFSTRANFKRHMRVHTNEKLSQCDVCGKRYTSTSQLRTHVAAAHLGVVFSCDECDKIYKTKAGLSCHKRTHKGIFSYVCMVCGRGFNYKTDFERHSLGHEDIKPHICEKCGRAFRSVNNLRRHVKTCGVTHRAFSCGTCGKQFKSERFLNYHVKIFHGNTVVFSQCSTCNALFRHTSSLYKHKKKTGHE